MLSFEYQGYLEFLERARTTYVGFHQRVYEGDHSRECVDEPGVARGRRHNVSTHHLSPSPVVLLHQ